MLCLLHWTPANVRVRACVCKFICMFLLHNIFIYLLGSFFSGAWIETSFEGSADRQSSIKFCLIIKAKFCMCVYLFVYYVARTYLRTNAISNWSGSHWNLTNKRDGHENDRHKINNFQLRFWSSLRLSVSSAVDRQFSCLAPLCFQWHSNLSDPEKRFNFIGGWLFMLRRTYQF